MTTTLPFIELSDTGHYLPVESVAVAVKSVVMSPMAGQAAGIRRAVG
ncbi:MAG: hypothetical protein ABI085_18190 [Gemmatimonadaceae bacterium]